MYNWIGTKKLSHFPAPLLVDLMMSSIRNCIVAQQFFLWQQLAFCFWPHSQLSRTTTLCWAFGKWKIMTLYLMIVNWGNGNFSIYDPKDNPLGFGSLKGDGNHLVVIKDSFKERVSEKSPSDTRWDSYFKVHLKWTPYKRLKICHF